jgi:hypothetical protein
MKTGKGRKVTDSYSSKLSDLSVKAFPGDGSVLLAFDLNKKLMGNLAGFAIQRTDQTGKSEYILNRFNFETKVDTTMTPEQRVWTSSDKAPFQKFRWVDFPSDPIGTCTYEVTAMYFDSKGSLTAGPAQKVTAELDLSDFKNTAIGFTRGYLSSQAYVARFQNKNIRPTPKSINYNIVSYENHYEWLGFHARKLIFVFLNECNTNTTCSVDMFVYDLDESDFIRGLQKLGSRLRAFFDDAPLHTKPGVLEPIALGLLQQSAARVM